MYSVPSEIRSTGRTFAEVAKYFSCEDALLGAIERLPNPRLQDLALQIVTGASRVETTKAKQISFGTYQRISDRYTIRLSARQCDSQSTMEDTFRHELAHFLDDLARGHTNHDKNWRAWAVAMGCQPRATAHDKTFSSAIAAERAGRRKPVARCEDCGREWVRERRKDWNAYSHVCPDGARGSLRNVFPDREEAKKFNHYSGGYFLEGDSKYRRRTIYDFR